MLPICSSSKMIVEQSPTRSAGAPLCKGGLVGWVLHNSSPGSAARTQEVRFTNFRTRGPSLKLLPLPSKGRLFSACNLLSLTACAALWDNDFLHIRLQSFRRRRESRQKTRRTSRFRLLLPKQIPRPVNMRRTEDYLSTNLLYGGSSHHKH